MRFSDDMVKQWSNFAVLQLIDRKCGDQTLAFVAVAHLCEVDCHALGLHYWFPNKYKARKLSLVSGSAPLVLKLADSTKEKVAETDSIRSIYQEDFPTRGMSFEFTKTAWLEYLEKKLDYFGILSFGA